MGSLVALLVIVIVSLVIVRIGTVALIYTGLSRDTASFQSYSAFFGVGFTTSEAELVVNHPVRRRIIRDLIIAGNIGLTSALGAVIVTFVRKDEAGSPNALEYIMLMAFGLLARWLLSRFRPLVALLDASIRYSMERAGVVRAMDYDLLLRVRAGYEISEIEVHAGHEFVHRSLAQSRLAERGLIVLGITRSSGEYVGAPSGNSLIEPDDVLTVYGEESAIRACVGAPEPHNATDPGRGGMT